MAMIHREPNQVKWVGVRPAHNGTQIAKSATANNAVVILHTVSAGKTFYLTHYNIEFDPTATGMEVRFLVRNAADVIQYDICYIAARAIATIITSGNLAPPIEIPEGYDIVLSSTVLNDVIRGFIHGWEE